MTASRARRIREIVEDDTEFVCYVSAEHHVYYVTPKRVRPRPKGWSILMEPFPHHYTVTTVANATEDVVLESDGVAPLPTTAPAQFGGSGDLWSPETLLVASIADCFILTFRAIAGASKFDWISLSCDVDGTLDRVDRVTQFTEFTMRVSLSVPPDADVERARQLLEKSDAKCLVTNSLKGSVRMEADVVVQSESENMA